MQYNWNKGILLANTEWIIFCHDDDYLDEDCIAHVYQSIKKYKGKCDCILPKLKDVHIDGKEENTVNLKMQEGEYWYYRILCLGN